MTNNIINIFDAVERYSFSLDIEFIKHLIDKGADIFSKRNFKSKLRYKYFRKDFTVLELACEHGYIEIVRLLLKDGYSRASLNNALRIAAKNICLNILLFRILIKKYENYYNKNRNLLNSIFIEIMKNFSEDIYYLKNKEEFCSPITIRLKRDKYFRIFKMLIERFNVDINSLDKNGNSPLLLSLKSCDFKTVNYLIDRGADISIKNKDGDNALIVTAKWGCNKIIKLLLKKGLKINGKNNKNGVTAIIKAIDNCHSHTVKLLVENGANINISCFYVRDLYKSYNKATPLLVAAERGKPDIIKLLLKHGADINKRNELNENALIIAYSLVPPENHLEEVGLLFDTISYRIKNYRATIESLLKKGLNATFKEIHEARKQEELRRKKVCKRKNKIERKNARENELYKYWSIERDEILRKIDNEIELYKDHCKRVGSKSI